MKKLICIVLALALATTSFIGCGKKEKDNSNETNVKNETNVTEAVTNDSEEVVVEVPAEKEPVTIKIWRPSREVGEFLEGQEAKFLEDHPYVTLDIIIHEGDPGNDYFQGIAAGNAPDVVPCSFTMMEKYIKAGVLEPINTYLDGWDETQNLPEKYNDMVTDADGNIYGLINSVSPMLFGYNKALFAEAGLENAPKTWDEMLEYAKVLTVPDKQQVGYGMLAKEWTEWFFQYYVWQAGGDLTVKEANNNLTPTFTDPAVIKAAEFYQTLRSEGVTQSDITMSFDDLVTAFAAGKIAMMPFAPDWVNWAIGLGMPAENIGLSLHPEGPAGNGAEGIGGTYWVINPNSDQAVKDASWEYISFMAGEEFIKAKFLDQAKNGQVDPLPIPRTNFTMTDIIPDYDPVLAALLEEASLNGRPEFYAKASVGKYVDAAVQKIIADQNADPNTEFEAAQKLVETEILPDFNK